LRRDPLTVFDHLRARLDVRRSATSTAAAAVPARTFRTSTAATTAEVAATASTPCGVIRFAEAAGINAASTNASDTERTSEPVASFLKTATRAAFTTSSSGMLRAAASAACVGAARIATATTRASRASAANTAGIRTITGWSARTATTASYDDSINQSIAILTHIRRAATTVAACSVAAKTTLRSAVKGAGATVGPACRTTSAAFAANNNDQSLSGRYWDRSLNATAVTARVAGTGIATGALGASSARAIGCNPNRRYTSRYSEDFLVPSEMKRSRVLRVALRYRARRPNRRLRSAAPGEQCNSCAAA